MKLALVLYACELLARRPQRVRVAARAHAAAAARRRRGASPIVASQPDLGTAMVIAFTVSALLVAAGMPLAAARDS